MNDDFGDRMKMYEMAEAGRRLMPLLPVIARIDGRCFSKFTKGMERPYDHRMSDCMIQTTLKLVKKTNACIGYTQSDEITLAWYSNNVKSQIFFDGRIQKMVSTLAAMASIYFNAWIQYKFGMLSNYALNEPTFDCRVWNVPTLEEGANCFLWREQDATKNSISMAARSQYSHTQLMNKNTSEMQEMLFQKGINWNDYPSFFKRGTYIQTKKVCRKFTYTELKNLPPKHEARQNPDLTIERSDVRILELPPFVQIKNRVGVIFFGEDFKC